MARRKTYCKLDKENEIREPHVMKMGDVLFKGFQCLNPKCQHFLFVRKSDIGTEFCIVCPKCGYEHKYAGETKFYDYSLQIKNEEGRYEEDSYGEFTISHDEYINEAGLYKYCIICNTIKPIHFFDKHGSRKSKHQGECTMCKKVYNRIKNKTRITDQHREAAQKRRLLLGIAGEPKIESKKVEQRFKNRCFNCGKDLSDESCKNEKHLDHTLPVLYLWPLTTENATLLCRDCNSDKSGSWPSDFYNDKQLKKLSILTGISYDVLSGKPYYNPEALAFLRNSEQVDALLAKFAGYMDEVIKLRNRIYKDTESNIDFFAVSNTISESYIRKADSLL